MNEWEQEVAFWSTCNVDTYDIESGGSCYSDYREMVKQKPEHDSPGFHGDWVRAEDYQKDIEELRDKVEAFARSLMGDSNDSCMSEDIGIDLLKLINRSK
jgi:hypothetical protein